MEDPFPTRRISHQSHTIHAQWDSSSILAVNPPVEDGEQLRVCSRVWMADAWSNSVAKAGGDIHNLALVSICLDG